MICIWSDAWFDFQSGTFLNLLNFHSKQHEKLKVEITIYIVCLCYFFKHIPDTADTLDSDKRLTDCDIVEQQVTTH